MIAPSGTPLSTSLLPAALSCSECARTPSASDVFSSRTHQSARSTFAVVKVRLSQIRHLNRFTVSSRWFHVDSLLFFFLTCFNWCSWFSCRLQLPWLFPWPHRKCLCMEWWVSKHSHIYSQSCVHAGSLYFSFLLFVSLSPGPSPDGSDGRSTSDGSSAHDVQPACSQTHQPLHTHTRSPGQLMQYEPNSSLFFLCWNCVCSKLAIIRLKSVSSLYLSFCSDAVYVILSGEGSRVPKATNKQQKKTTQGERSDGRTRDLIELKETDGRQDNNQHQKTSWKEERRRDTMGERSSCLLFVWNNLRVCVCVCEWLLFSGLLANLCFEYCRQSDLLFLFLLFLFGVMIEMRHRWRDEGIVEILPLVVSRTRSVRLLLRASATELALFHIGAILSSLGCRSPATATWSTWEGTNVCLVCAWKHLCA